MIPRWFVLFAALAAMLVLGISCTGNGSDLDSPLAPARPEFRTEGASQEHGFGHSLWGYYLIYVNPEENEIEVIPVRGVADHWNVLRWLEQGPCTDCVKITNFVDSGHGTKLVDVQIRHPFSGLPNLTGFDVRGIAMFNGSHEFPVAAVTVPDRSQGDGELVNADGYTGLYNITTIGCGPGGLQGYIQGKFATFQVPDALLNGYKRHITDDPANTRNAFYSGDSVTVTYEIDMPDGPFVLGYAVDASWAPPIEKPVDDPMTDFGLEANCPEPWKIEVRADPIGDTGETTLIIDVFDWQGKLSHSAPVVECPELFDGSLTAEWTQMGPGFSRWRVTVANTRGAHPGSYDCLISVEDNENDPAAKPWLDLSAYQVATLEVAVTGSGWARTWGGDDVDQSYDVAVDDGNIYAVGCFSSTVDFDPGPEVDSHSSNGLSDAFLSKFDRDGSHLWTAAWGGSDQDRGHGVCVDSQGGVYVAGYFTEEVDFDPDPLTDERHTSNGAQDVFVSKFDPNGDFVWVQAWGDIGDDCSLGIDVDNADNLCVMGYCRTPTGQYDTFLRKLDASGNLVWARQWGGTDYPFEYTTESGIDVDKDDNIYVTGLFEGTVDFDPGSGTDEHTCNGCTDVFLTKFNSQGDFQWARTWGGGATWIDDCGHGVAADHLGNVYVVGYFAENADFDPGPGEDWHEADGWDGFLSKFNSDGEYQWARVWGGEDTLYNGWYYAETCTGVDVDYSGDVYVTGNFDGDMDFDPGPGLLWLSSEFITDAFLIKLDTNGVIIWARNWGGTDECCDQYDSLFWETGVEVTVDDSGRAYVAGFFSSEPGSPADFAPSDPPCNEEPDIHDSNGAWDAFLVRFLPDGCW